MQRVLIIKPVCERFRAPFYEQLGDALADRRIALRVLYGQPERHEAEMATVVPRYCEPIRNVWLSVCGTDLSWQRINWRDLLHTDLVVVQQGNGNILNHALIAMRGLYGYKLALWGHGRNFQSSQGSAISERLKQLYSKRVDYWFAYTERSCDVIRRLGYPNEQITCVNNTIDVEREACIYDSLCDEELRPLRRALGIPDGAVIGIYCGRLYKQKLSFLLSALSDVRTRCPSFHFLMLGDGPERAEVAAFARHNSEWFHYIGPHFGSDKTRFFRLASFQMMPGVVGLAIVDSFALLTPLFTTRRLGHGPEIGYLVNGVNGVIAANDQRAYSDAVVEYAFSPDRRRVLIEGCLRARRQYGLAEMVARFSEGICRALAMGRGCR